MGIMPKNNSKIILSISFLLLILLTNSGQGYSTVLDTSSDAILGNELDLSDNPIESLDADCKSQDLEDVDGDMIPNEVEINGMDINRDGIIDFNLKNKGASPFHKDIFVEVDYMTNHKPSEAAIAKVKDVFSNSPLCNPDGSSGINLHIEISDEFDEKISINLIDPGATTLDKYTHFTDLYMIKSDLFGNHDERFNQNVNNTLDAKRLLYHYALFVHTINNSDSLLGIAKNIPAWDFAVSLGASNGIDEFDHATGTETQQAATLCMN
jgi:hypothetical protein